MNLFSIKPSRKPSAFYLSGRVKNVLHVDQGIRRINEYFEFDTSNTDHVHECQHVFNQVLICCQLLGKRHDDPKEFEEAFDLFRRSHTAN